MSRHLQDWLLASELNAIAIRLDSGIVLIPAHFSLAIQASATAWRTDGQIRTHPMGLVENDQMRTGPANEQFR